MGMRAVIDTQPRRGSTRTGRPAPSSGERLSPRAGGRARRLRRPIRLHLGALLRRGGIHGPGLALLLLITFLLRVWGIKQGLPYSYNVDEATHFVPRAIAFSWHDLNPHYFLNPPAYSYLLHVVFELWFGSADATARAYARNPSEVFVVARVVAAILGTGAVWLTYLAGVRLGGRNIGLLAAAIFGMAFLPIFYSHLALNDVPTLAPVTLALYGVAGVVRWGRGRDYLVAGIGIGLASATKYTGGIMLVFLLGAFGCDGARQLWWQSLRRLALGLLAALMAFLIANPYALLDFPAFWSGLSSQASLANGQEPVKLGTTAGGGIVYYLRTFTWGLGWVPTVAAAGGAAAVIARRRLDLALVLLPAPIVFIIFMGTQQRYFGRWLMPVFPVVALLAAYGGLEAMRLLASLWRVAALRLRRPILLAAGAPGVIALVSIGLIAPSLAAVLHDDAVLSRPDTRALTRAWMVRHIPAGDKVVIEPAVPDNWASDVGVTLPSTPTGERWWRYPTWLTELDQQLRPLPTGERRFVFVDEYERTLRPALVHRYLAGGFCWVVVTSLQAGRASADPHDVPGAIAYYAALARSSRLYYHATPFAAHSPPVGFSFDFSIDYYPGQYRLPGPEMSVYKLIGGRCARTA